MSRKRWHILIRSSWQTVNIGDIAHTPGVLRMLETYLPEASVTLWAVRVDRGAAEMLRKRFPDLRIVHGQAPGAEDASPELADAFDQGDMLLHGSAPQLLASRSLETWRRLTGKPYGIFGVTVEPVHETLRSVLDGASFTYCRDGVTLEAMQRQGIASPVLAFGPDATFACDLVDRPAAEAFLREKGLADEPFVCFLSRMRYSPYFQIRNHPATERDKQRHAVSLQHLEADHAKMRQAITRCVRETGMKVLVCPEMTYQVELGRKALYDPLPDDVKAKVVLRDRYWMPDEAAATYARATAMVSGELHSPILATVMGVPAIYVRLPTDTCKGQMWRDIGLPDWIFEVEETDGNAIADRLLEIVRHNEQARNRVRQAQRFVHQRMAEAAHVMRNCLVTSQAGVPVRVSR